MGLLFISMFPKSSEIPNLPHVLQFSLCLSQNAIFLFMRHNLNFFCGTRHHRKPKPAYPVRCASDCKGCLHKQSLLSLETGVCKHSAAQVGDADGEKHSPRVSPYVTLVSDHLLLSHLIRGSGVLVGFTWHSSEYLRRETQLKELSSSDWLMGISVRDYLDCWWREESPACCEQHYFQVGLYKKAS